MRRSVSCSTFSSDIDFDSIFESTKITMRNLPQNVDVRSATSVHIHINDCPVNIHCPVHAENKNNNKNYVLDNINTKHNSEQQSKRVNFQAQFNIVEKETTIKIRPRRPLVKRESKNPDSVMAKNCKQFYSPLKFAMTFVSVILALILAYVIVTQTNIIQRFSNEKNNNTNSA